MERELHPLETILADIQKALDARLWYVAIAVALSIPDICSLLERNDETDGWSKKEKYAAWFDQYVAPKFDSLTGNDCYCLRGGVLHKGRFGHHKMQFDRMIFSIPDPNTGLFFGEGFTHGDDGGEKVLILGAATFCLKIITSAREWLERMSADPNVKANSEWLVRYRPNGFPSVILGLPFIG